MHAILVIGDDDRQNEALSECLANAGFFVEVSRDGDPGSDVVLSRDFVLVVLALLGAGNEAGFERLRRICPGCVSLSSWSRVG